MEHGLNEPQPAAQPTSPWAHPAPNDSLALAGDATRHDGWTGERMASFCEALADSGLVVDACLAAGKSTNTAYALRRRNSVFAAAWDAALTIARERLADTLLARSIEGSVEQYYKDGELVGEKRVIDNRLGLAILRRLDRMAETGTPVSTRGERTLYSGGGRSPDAPRQQRSRTAVDRARPARSLDWDLALAALRSGDGETVAEALAMLRGELPEAHETHDPPNPLIQSDRDDDSREPDDPADRCWQEDDDGRKYWMTGFPPPAGFTGHQFGQWGDGDYQRECSPEESTLLDRTFQAELGDDRDEDAALRDAWFASLAARLPGGDGVGATIA